MPFARARLLRAAIADGFCLAGALSFPAIIRPCDHAGGRLRQHGRDVARYFAQLSPMRKQRALRREPARDDAPAMAQSAFQPRESLRPRSPSGTVDGWDWFGHSGGLQGYISSTCVYPTRN